MTTGSSSFEPLHSVIESLPEEFIPRAGFAPKLLAGGRNNRVYLASSADHGRYILKIYNPAVVDGATRLQRESAFLTWLKSQGVAESPELLHSNAEHNFAIIGFREGDRLPAERIGAGHIRQAAQFVLRLNEGRESDLAHSVPRASEGCFSLAEHADALAARLARLDGIETDTAPGMEAAAFTEDELLPASHAVLDLLRREAAAESEVAVKLSPAQRWLSPSDFGFHNALAGGGDKLVFIDFEHAGWDDPAKMIADFCNQPDLPLPDELARPFVEAILEADPDPGLLQGRLDLLTPLYQLKWACILLNEFLPSGGVRREFLGRDRIEDVSPEKERQLRRARQMVGRATGGESA